MGFQFLSKTGYGCYCPEGWIKMIMLDNNVIGSNSFPAFDLHANGIAGIEFPSKSVSSKFNISIWDAYFPFSTPFPITECLLNSYRCRLLSIGLLLLLSMVKDSSVPKLVSLCDEFTIYTIVLFPFSLGFLEFSTSLYIIFSTSEV